MGICTTTGSKHALDPDYSKPLLQVVLRTGLHILTSTNGISPSYALPWPLDNGPVGKPVDMSEVVSFSLILMQFVAKESISFHQCQVDLIRIFQDELASKGCPCKQNGSLVY